MKIYIASSWKNRQLVEDLARQLRNIAEQEVYCFAEEGDKQHIFMWQDVATPDDDGITALELEDSSKAFKIDFDGLMWANCCLLVLPSGRDSHLEAGFIRGKGGKLIIIGDWPKGEFSNMYHLAHKQYRWEQLAQMYLDMRALNG